MPENAEIRAPRCQPVTTSQSRANGMLYRHLTLGTGLVPEKPGYRSGLPASPKSEKNKTPV